MFRTAKILLGALSTAAVHHPTPIPQVPRTTFVQTRTFATDNKLNKLHQQQRLLRGLLVCHHILLSEFYANYHWQTRLLSRTEIDMVIENISPNEYDHMIDLQFATNMELANSLSLLKYCRNSYIKKIIETTETPSDIFPLPAEYDYLEIN